MTIFQIVLGFLDRCATSPNPPPPVMELRRRKGGGNERDEAETDKKGASSARNGARQPQSSSIAVLSISVGRFQVFMIL